jgi:hypothetical protein
MSDEYGSDAIFIIHHSSLIVPFLFAFRAGAAGSVRRFV